MPAVRLSDLFIPQVYDSYTTINSPETTALLESGIVVRSPQLDAFAGQPSTQMTIPFWNDLDANIEPNYYNDDPADVSVPNKLGTGFQMVRKSFLHQSYAVMDLARELAGSDPMRRIQDRFGVYWQRQLQRRLIATALGVLNDNVATDNSDMVTDVSTQDGNSATAANLFSRNSFIDANFTMGDATSGFAVMACHSVVAKRLSKSDDIEFIRDSEGKVVLTRYMGAVLVMDDSMPVFAGTTSGYRYVTALFGSGAMLWGSGTPLVPSYVDRSEQRGNGGGMEEIGERKEWLLHPNGYSWLEDGAPIVEFSPTLADLKLAAHWDRKLPRKNVNMAFMITNG